MSEPLKKVDMSLLHTIADMDGLPAAGAFNIRRNGQGVARQSSENITIEPKSGKPGIDIYIKPFTKGEEVHIPVIITESGINDKVYNDFYVGEGAEKALGRFLSNTESKLTDEMYKKAEELGMSMDEVITLASIIQQEASVPSVMANVSSVLHNRLNSPSYPRLQCDATIFYLKRSVKPYIGEEQADKYDEFYNTYDRKGLPAGPITNPGIEAINAALNPADTEYYFFVTDNDGNYYFAKTYREHLENCKTAGVGQ